MSLIHLIVIFHVIMYIWNMTEAADGNDPMQGVKDLKEEVRKERIRVKLKREAEQAEAAEARAAAAAAPAAAISTGGRKSQRGGESLFERAKKKAKKLTNKAPGPSADAPASAPTSDAPTSDEPAAASAEAGSEAAAGSSSQDADYARADAIMSKPVQVVEDANTVAKKLIGERPPFNPRQFWDERPAGDGRMAVWVGACVIWFFRSLIVFILTLGISAMWIAAYLVLMITLIVLNCYELIPMAYKWGKEFIFNIGELYKRRTNALSLFIQLIPAIAVFYTIGLWFAPTFGLGICIAYAIFVQLKMTAFILFGAKNANLTKAHLRKCRYGLTFMTLLMIGYTANQNLKFNTSIGVTLAFTACMFIMLCR